MTDLTPKGPSSAPSADTWSSWFLQKLRLLPASDSVPATDLGTYFYAAPHELTGELPNEADCRIAVTQLIDDLAAAGSLDGGTGYVLDELLLAQGRTWKTRVERKATDRQRTSLVELNDAYAQLVRVRSRLSSLRLKTLRHQKFNEATYLELAGQWADPDPAAATLDNQHLPLEAFGPRLVGTGVAEQSKHPIVRVVKHIETKE